MQTADGPYDPAAGKFGNSVLALTFKDLRLVDSFTPENWEYLNAKDLDLSSANAVAFPFQGKTIVASVGKESVMSLLDGDDLGGANHQTPLYRSPRWGNDEALLHDRGVWGAMATWEDAQGRRYLAMSMLGPVGKSAPRLQVHQRHCGGRQRDGVRSAAGFGHDETHAGAAVDVPRTARARRPCRGERRGLHVSIRQGFDRDPRRRAAPRRPGQAEDWRPPRRAAAQVEGPARPARPASLGTNAILYAFDADTGKQLFSSELDSFNHFTNPVVAGGTVYAVTWDGKLYAFGLKK